MSGDVHVPRSLLQHPCQRRRLRFRGVERTRHARMPRVQVDSPVKAQEPYPACSVLLICIFGDFEQILVDSASIVARTALSLHCLPTKKAALTFFSEWTFVKALLWATFQSNFQRFPHPALAARSGLAFLRDSRPAARLGEEFHRTVMASCTSAAVPPKVSQSSAFTLARQR